MGSFPFIRPCRGLIIGGWDCYLPLSGAIDWMDSIHVGVNPYAMLFDPVGVVMGCWHPIDRAEALPYVI